MNGTVVWPIEHSVCLVRSDSAPLLVHTLKAALSLLFPSPKDPLALQNLDGKNSEFGAILSLPVFTAILKPVAQNSHSDGPHSRAASSMGNAEGLVKV